MLNKKLICLFVVTGILTSTVMSSSTVYATDNQKTKDSSNYQRNLTVQEDVTIDEQNFPDKVFRDWVLTTADKDSNNALTAAEMDSIRSIYLSKKGIENLTGIKNFKNLDTLTCNENQMTSLDVSGMPKLRRIEVNKNNLVTLDVSKTRLLEILYASENQLTDVNTDQAVKLKDVTLNGNPIDSIDFTSNVALNDLIMRGTNLKSIDLSQNTALQYLTLPDNDLTSIDLTYNTELLQITLSNFGEFSSTTVNQIEYVDVSNCPKLTKFLAENIKINKVDFSNNPELKVIYLNSNQLEFADFSKNLNLTDLHLKDNVLKSINLEGLPGSLLDVRLNNNKLENIDVSSQTNLKTLEINNNLFKNINLDANTKLTRLDISSNPIKILDLKENVLLSTLRVNNCLLETLDLKANPNLSYLYADANALPMLDLSLNTNLVRDNIGTQKIESGHFVQNNGQYTFDLTSVLPKSELSNITVTNAISFDQNTGIATYDVLPLNNIIQYTYNTSKYPMKVEVTAKQSFSVVYNTQGGNDIATENVIDGNTIVNQITPQREGYVFKGWYKEEGCINQWNPSTDTVTSDITLYAKWEAVPTKTNYKVNFDFMDGLFDGVKNPSFEVVVKDDENLTTYPLDTLMNKEGYVFKGWYKEEECKNQWNLSTDKVTSDITLYAKWEEVPIDVPSDNPTPNPEQPNKIPENKPNSGTSDNVKTSDNNQVGQYIVLLVISLLVPICLIGKLQDKRKQ